MSTWHIILLLVFVFFVALFYSLSKTPSTKRTVMRSVSLIIFLGVGIVIYMMNGMLREARKCPDSGKFFYKNNTELCYSTLSMKMLVKDKKGIEINDFFIIDNNSAVFNTAENAQYSLAYEEPKGLFIEPLN